MKTSIATSGFVLIDAIFGLMMIGAVVVVFSRTAVRVRHTEESLADMRSAAHLAEHALLNVQHHLAIPPGASIHPATGGRAPAGYTWAKVDAAVHGHHQSLIGIIPE